MEKGSGTAARPPRQAADTAARKRKSPTGCTGWKQQTLQVAALPLVDHLRERGIERFHKIN